MTTNRREFIAGVGATLAVLPGLQACAKREPAASVQAQLAGIAEDMLVDYPENATSLGIDTGARAALKARLTDRSAAGQEAISKRVTARVAQLKAVDAASLDAGDRIDLDVVRTAHETAVDGFKFPYGDVALLNSNWSWRNAPYVVAQNTGAFLEIPSLLEEQHTVANAEDAEAYLARLEAYAGQLEGETGRLASAAAQGVIAPDFILDTTLAQLKLSRDGDVAAWPFVASFALLLFFAPMRDRIQSAIDIRRGHADVGGQADALVISLRPNPDLPLPKGILQVARGDALDAEGRYRGNQTGVGGRRKHGAGYFREAVA